MSNVVDLEIWKGDRIAQLEASRARVTRAGMSVEAVGGLVQFDFGADPIHALSMSPSQARFWATQLDEFAREAERNRDGEDG